MILLLLLTLTLGGLLLRLSGTDLLLTELFLLLGPACTHVRLLLLLLADLRIPDLVLLLLTHL